MTLHDLDQGKVRDLVRAALDEDGAFSDITTLTTVPPDQLGHGFFLAKQDGVLAGLAVAESAFLALDERIEFRAEWSDSQRFEAGTKLAEVEGPLGSILAAERVALNFLQRLCGVATTTRALVDSVGGLPVRVVDTRKTTPGLRVLERYAVRAGGGSNHRYNLADGVLIKDNHIAAGRSRGLSIGDVIAAARAGAPHTLRIEVEVMNMVEAEAALAAGADVILLDNMTTEEMSQAVGMIGGRALTEASGRVTSANARSIAETGVDIMSSGSLTHSAQSIDISLDIETLGG